MFFILMHSLGINTYKNWAGGACVQPGNLNKGWATGKMIALELLRSIGEPITTWGYLNLNQLKWNEKFFSHISHNSYAQLPHVAGGYLLKSPDRKHFYSFRKVMLDSAANHRDIKTAGDAYGLLFSAGTWSMRFSTHIWKGCRSVKSQEIQELRSCCFCASRTLNVQPYHLGIFKCRY